MEIPLCLLLVLFASSCVINLVFAQSQGFINLACGMMQEDFSLPIPKLKLTYISDAEFIDGGESAMIQKEYQELYLRHKWYIRSFPEGRRNCYNLNVTRGKKYLVRAGFVYGNYDSKGESPIFDLHIGPNKWDTVDLVADANMTTKEIIHVSTSNSLQVCLVKTGDATPFISTLELRPLTLSNDIYNTRGGSLVTRYRRYLGVVPSYIRFPDDVHDRLWNPWNNISDPFWTSLNTFVEVNTSNEYQLPETVMKMGKICTNGSSLTWNLNPPNSKMYLYLHFAEIQDLKPNETREFNIKLNGEQYYGPMSPKRFEAQTIPPTSPIECNYGNCTLEFIRTDRSTHPPLVNAIEIYTVAEFQYLETDQNDVDAIKNIKKQYGLKKTSWQGDPCAPQGLIWAGLKCTFDPPRISTLNLSSNGVEGDISPYIQNLTQLKVLDLSNNSLRRGVPEFLAKMRSLFVIKLNDNMLNGSVPQVLIDRVRNGSLRLYVQGNQNLYCPSDVCKNKELHDKTNAHKLVLWLTISVSSFLAIAAVFTIYLILQKKQSERTRGAFSIARSNNLYESPVLSKERRFKYSDILRITNNMDKILGRGGFGTVYHGHLSDTLKVAVKVLLQPSRFGHKQFRAEVELLLRVHHKNLVRLVGYCEEKCRMALIYEYMANGDLKNFLAGKPGSNILSWMERMNIAIDAAQGLEYLHNGCKPSMVHRDVKTANILLDEKLQAKVADFGLSRSFDSESNTHISTVVAGTPGYLDPEYNRTSRLTEKSDVYSFGVVLLEIITNQPVLNNNAPGGYHIVEWVTLVLRQGDIQNIVDPRLRGEFDIGSAWKALEVAMACVSPSPSRRPSMGYVVAELNECLASETARCHGTGASMNCNDMNFPLLDDSASSPTAR